MSTLFKKLFIKNYQDTSNPAVRTRYGTASGLLGIFANALLFALKLFAGILSGSIAVIADAINNLSDFLTSIITLVGFRLSARPADKEHPYGHARIEYVTALIVAFLILMIGIETGRASIDKLLAVSPTDFSIITCAILGASIIVKLILSKVFNDLSKDIDSDALRAMSTDSRNDVISTFVVLVCAIIGLTTGLSLDGWLGIAVSLFVIYSAINLIKETIDPLLGVPPEKEFIQKIENKLKSYDGILDIHDLVVHNYGPTKTFATVHIEVDCKIDVMISHDLSDNIERDFYREMGIILVCHLDPVNVDDPETCALKSELFALIKSLDDKLSFHDFRVVKGVTHTNVIFDVVLPFDAKCTQNQIKDAVNEKLKTYQNVNYYAVIEFDTNFNE